MSRYTHAAEFIERASAQGTEVAVAECGFGERPFEIVTGNDDCKIAGLKESLRIPEQAAHDSGMMPPTHSEIIPPTVPR